MKRYLLIAMACFCLAAELGAAVVAGKVTFVTKRGQKPVVNETLVWLDCIGAKPQAKKPAPLQVTTRGKTLLPHVMAIPAGSTITFPNDDPISHNLFSLAPGNTFDLGLYRKGTGKSHTFAAPGVVNVYCNVHPTMSAVVHVMSTPYYCFADANGNYSLDVPPGKYRVTAWNEQGGTVFSDITVAADGGIVGATALTIDGRNYRFNQHTNKFGKIYQPPKDY
jgi:plastocyanin